jgi:hypothetical protein
MPSPAFSTIRHATPEAAVRGYFAGSDHCSSRDLRAAFHPAAHMWWLDGDTVRARTMLAWWQLTDAQSPCVPALERQLVVLDREGPMALVAATSRFASFTFHDLLLVADTPHGWLIVDKVFERLAPDAAITRADDPDVRAVLATKITAATTTSAALLAATHLDDCVYSRIHAGDPAYARETVSEWAARYALRHERPSTDPASQWHILAIHASGHIAAAKLDVVSPTARHIDHLLLLRTPAGWRIAAASWGAGTPH